MPASKIYAISLIEDLNEKEILLVPKVRNLEHDAQHLGNIGSIRGRASVVNVKSTCAISLLPYHLLTPQDHLDVC